LWTAIQRDGKDVPFMVQVTEERLMTSLSASRARANLFKLMEQAADSHEPIQINGRHRSSVLVSEEDWRAVQETLYLLSVPGMRESIRKGLATPLSKTSKTLRW
jgi:antitoxin YefM